MQKLIQLCLCIFMQCTVAAQNLPGFRQFYFNPFLFNPAFTGLEGFTEFSLTHRQQWLDVTDAPKSSGFGAQFPTQSRVSLGFNLLTQESVALRSTSAKAVFSYRIPISSYQMFSFGISAGAGYNSLDLDGIDYSNDPAILGAIDNRVYADGSFGALYSLHGLKIGFALPRLFGQPYMSPQSLGGNNFSQLRNQLYSISYKLNVFQGKVALEPYFIYRLNRDLQHSWESYFLVFFEEKFWTGVFYHPTQGIAFLLGMLIKDRFRFGYSYEMPPFDKEFIPTSSHEMHISIRLGKKKGRNSNVVISESPKSEGPQTSVPKVLAETKVEIVIFPDSVRQPPVIEEKISLDSVSNLDKIVLSIPPNTKVLGTGYYVVVGSYRTFENALNLERSLRSKGHTQVFTGFYERNGLYYVSIFSTYNLTEAKGKVKIYAEIVDFKDTWILKIE